ncbi:MAG TPA: hypothetical protein DDW90_10705 [Cyanobacteria bacterium UBA9971]|nr:hypothetical protein [Cyanobacteria bacterium UBA9971]
MLSKARAKKFEFLKEPFQEWFLVEYFKADSHDLAIDSDLLNSLKINKDEFYNLFLKPYLSMDLEQIEQVLYHQAKYIRERHLPNPAPFNLEIKMKSDTRLNALSWLLVNIKDLNFFELDYQIEKYYEHPYKQCHYCGKPNSYEHEEGQKEFNDKTKFCHSFKCDCRYESNPQEHKDCCYGKWTIKKKALEQKIKFGQKTNEEKINYFIEFCEKQLKYYINDVDWTIQLGENEQRAIGIWEFFDK